MTEEQMDQPSIEERIAHCRRTLEAGEGLPVWKPTRWVSALSYRLGQAALHAEEHENAVEQVYPGTSVDALEAMGHDLVVIAAVAIDALTALEASEATR